MFNVYIKNHTGLQVIQVRTESCETLDGDKSKLISLESFCGPLRFSFAMTEAQAVELAHALLLAVSRSGKEQS